MDGSGNFTKSWGQQRGQDYETEITIALEDAYHGAKKSISLQGIEPTSNGRARQRTLNYDIKIPPGVTEGSRIRLAGQGGNGVGGGPNGDLHITIHLKPHPAFRVNGHDIETFTVTPWEARLARYFIQNT